MVGDDFPVVGGDFLVVGNDFLVVGNDFPIVGSDFPTVVTHFSGNHMKPRRLAVISTSYTRYMDHGEEA